MYYKPLADYTNAVYGIANDALIEHTGIVGDYLPATPGEWFDEVVSQLESCPLLIEEAVRLTVVGEQRGVNPALVVGAMLGAWIYGPHYVCPAELRA
jgi:hypothetical protein